MERNSLCIEYRYCISTNKVNTTRTSFKKQLSSTWNREETSKLSAKGSHTVTTTQLLKTEKTNLSSGNSNLTFEYFDITIIWEYTTCGISQQCNKGSTKPSWLSGNLALERGSKHSTYFLHIFIDECYQLCSQIFLNTRMPGYYEKLNNETSFIRILYVFY